MNFNFCKLYIKYSMKYLGFTLVKNLLLKLFKKL